MKAEITFEELYLNNSVMKFFFREQSIRTLEELLEKVGDTTYALGEIEDFANTFNYSLDDMEEIFYESTVEELANMFGLEI